MSLPPLTARPAWKLLGTHCQQLKPLHLRKLFADDPGRGSRLALEAAGIYFDYSKNRITDETLKLLVQLANESQLRQRIDANVAGERINTTENRAVLHVALRAPEGATISDAGDATHTNVVPLVHAVLNKMAAFAEQVRSGRWLGHTGLPIKNVVNIG